MIDTLLSHTMPLPTSTSSVGPVPTVIPGTKPVFQEVHDVGRRTLWVVTVLMALSSLVFYILGARSPLSKRVFHTLTSLIATISFLIYLALATGQGFAWKRAACRSVHKHVPDTTQEYFRQVQWLRYVNWTLTTPLLLINFALLSGLPGGNLVVAIAADLVMLAAGLFGTFAGHTPERWVWFAISCIGYLTVCYHAGFRAQQVAQNKDAQTRRFHGAISGSALAVMALYPISLAAGALALRLSVDAEIILFAVLDVVTQGILGYWLLLSHDSSPGITLYVDGFWSRGVGNEGAIRIEEEGA